MVDTRDLKSLGLKNGCVSSSLTPGTINKNAPYGAFLFMGLEWVARTYVATATVTFESWQEFLQCVNISASFTSTS